MQFLLKKFQPTSNLRCLIILFFFIFFLLLQNSISGSKNPLFIFTLSFALLVISVATKWRGFFYSISATLLLLGIWVKFTWHNLSGLDYVEPTGLFAFSTEQWNEVFEVSTVGCLGLISSIIIFELAIDSFKNLKPRFLPTYPCIQQNARKIITFFLGLILVILFLNLVTGICIVGISPQTILLWPMNAVITLLIMGGGIALISAILVWILICNQVNYFKTTCIFILLGTLINIACLSRGLILSLVIPPIFVLFKYGNDNQLGIITFKAKAALISLLILAMISSFIIVNMLRDNFYYKETNLEALSVNYFLKNSHSILYSKIQSFMHFSIDRWTGIEGVMATVGFKEKHPNLLLNAILDKPVNKPALYEKICPWPESITTSLNPKTRNFSIPGIIGFLYYSNSKLIVFLGVSVIGFLGILVEFLVFRLLGNPIFSASLAWTIATNFIMFSGVPMFQIPNIIFWALIIYVAFIITKIYLVTQPLPK